MNFTKCFFFRPSSGSSLPETFSEQLEGEYFSTKHLACVSGSWADVRDWFILGSLNVLCFQGENGDRGLKGEKGDSNGDFLVSGPPGLPGNPGLVVSSDASTSSSSMSHGFPWCPLRCLGRWGAGFSHSTIAGGRPGLRPPYPILVY